jgi:tetratricopeptide (TPR) repeat protein
MEHLLAALALGHCDEQADDPAALGQVHNLLGILASTRGEQVTALRHLETSRALADRVGDVAATVAVLNNLALVHRGARDLGPALQLTRAALDLCAAQGDRHREAALHNNLADLLHAAGEPEEAMRHLKRAVAIFAEVGVEGEPRPEVWKLVRW